MDRRGVGEVLDVLSRLESLGPGLPCGVLAIRPKKRSSRAMCCVRALSRGFRPGSATTTEGPRSPRFARSGPDGERTIRHAAIPLRFRRFYCRPGIDGTHEKGGVEGEIGRFRRDHLVPIPRLVSLAELNDADRPGRPDRQRPWVTGRRAAVSVTPSGLERPALRALPDERFDSAADPAGVSSRSPGPDLCPPVFTRSPLVSPRSRCWSAWSPSIWK